MRKKILAALTALMILTMLGGCQLAVADNEMNPGKDRLCGVFVTLDYLDIPFDDNEFEVPINWNGDPSSIVFPETRIYATRTEDENGSANFTFDGVDGFSLFEVKVDYPDSDGFCWTGIVDGLEDVSTKISDNNVQLTGTIYFDVHNPSFSIFANPVYQTPDGQVYLTNGTGITFSGESGSSGGSMSLSETMTETIDGKETSHTTEVEIKAEAVNTNKKVVLKQMNSRDEVIAQTEITQDAIPESIQVDKDTAYMIMEEHCVDYENKASVKRTLIKPDEYILGARFTSDNGIAETHPVTLDYPWKEESDLL